MTDNIDAFYDRSSANQQSNLSHSQSNTNSYHSISQSNISQYSKIGHQNIPQHNNFGQLGRESMIQSNHTPTLTKRGWAFWIYDN